MAGRKCGCTPVRCLITGNRAIIGHKQTGFEIVGREVPVSAPPPESDLDNSPIVTARYRPIAEYFAALNGSRSAFQRAYRRVAGAMDNTVIFTQSFPERERVSPITDISRP